MMASGIGRASMWTAGLDMAMKQPMSATEGSNPLVSNHLCELPDDAITLIAYQFLDGRVV